MQVLSMIDVYRRQTQYLQDPHNVHYPNGALYRLKVVVQLLANLVVVDLAYYPVVVLNRIFASTPNT
jgi:histidinol-phosphate/aromatic aminotransferase/cobyric acid decarboxylase-like protein